MKKYFIAIVLTVCSIFGCFSEKFVNFQVQFGEAFCKPRYDSVVDIETEKSEFGKFALQLEYLRAKENGFSFGARGAFEYTPFSTKLKYGKEMMCIDMDGYGWELAPAIGWTIHTKFTTMIQLISYPVIFSHRYIDNWIAGRTYLQDGTPVITFRHKKARICWKTGLGASIQWGPTGWKHGIVGGINYIIADNYFEKGMRFDPGFEFSVGYKMSIGL